MYEVQTSELGDLERFKAEFKNDNLETACEVALLVAIRLIDAREARLVRVAHATLGVVLDPIDIAKRAREVINSRKEAANGEGTR